MNGSNIYLNCLQQPRDGLSVCFNFVFFALPGILSNSIISRLAQP